MYICTEYSVHTMYTCLTSSHATGVFPVTRMSWKF